MQQHQRVNRETWTEQVEWYAVAAEKNWQAKEPYWGLWGISDVDYKLMPDSLAGKECLEIGCGTAYVSAWMSRRGGTVYGIDPTPGQLATASRMMAKHDVHFPLVEGFGESLPFPDDSFDFVISEYGAALWADPYQWVPEAHRVMRNGASLTLMVDHLLAFVSVDEDDKVGQSQQLQRSYFDAFRMRWTPEDGVEFHLTHAEWIALFNEYEFEIERLIEVQAPVDANSRYEWADPVWARKWPAEEIWVVRKR